MTGPIPTQDITNISTVLNHPSRVIYLFLKRLVDIIASLLAIVLLSPVFILAGLGIMSESKGPLFYRQTRV
jgi:lipopolysaccharide/colanic/teichoic acid biosynthesis glycosyltransferase